MLHVVNYNLPLTDPPDTRTVRSVENLKLRLKVPDGWSAVEGRALEPGVETMPVAVEARAGAVEMVVPKIRYYKVLDLSAEVR